MQLVECTLGTAGNHLSCFLSLAETLPRNENQHRGVHRGKFLAIPFKCLVSVIYEAVLILVFSHFINEKILLLLNEFGLAFK